MAELDVAYCESIDGHESDIEFEPPDKPNRNKQPAASGKAAAA